MVEPPSTAVESPHVPREREESRPNGRLAGKRPVRTRALGAAGRSWALIRTYPLLAAAIVGGVGARLVFWAMTDRKFEDGLTAVAHARNAAEGLGLTHHPGEGPVHGFTAAASVLVPLAGELADPGPGAGFFAVRTVSIAAFAVAAVCAHAIAQRLGLGFWPTAFVLGYLAFDQNQIFYGMSGMETQLAVAVLLGGIVAIMRDRTLLTGALLGMALLTRPDFVLWVAPAFVYLFLRNRIASVKAALVTGAVVLPWLVFTVLYYGSPIPNSVKAKSERYPIEAPSLLDVGAWPRFLWDELVEKTSFWHAFTPLLENGFIYKTPFPAYLLSSISLVFIVLAFVGAWVTRSHRWWLPAVAFAAIFALYRIYMLPHEYYEWYLPPFMAVVALLAGAGLEALRGVARRTAVLLAAFLTLAFAVHMPFSFPLEASVQHDIENRVRVLVGVWLGDIVRPGEKVASESPGYIGYFSGVTIYDYPGLTSPGARRILAPLGQENHNMFAFVNAARTEWVVVRPFELEALRQTYPDAADAYEVAKSFSVPFEESDLRRGGVEMINIDRDFLVLRRKAASAGGGAP